MIKSYLIGSIGGYPNFMSEDFSQNRWDEDTSKRYLDFGRSFVPEREGQMRIIVDLLKGVPQPSLILELG